MDVKQKIISLSQKAGACSIGFADVVGVSKNWSESFQRMLQQGRHGSMAFMERYCDIRQDPSLLLPKASTLISLAFSYDKGARNRLIASYALVEDYHYHLRQLLAPVVDFLEQELGAQCRICVDSAPVAERYWALRTGVGVRGRNQQLMVPGVGARVFLAEILTTAHITPDPMVEEEGYWDACAQCDLCVRACPNGALEDPDGFDARRCVSYLTIEHRGDLPQGLSLAGKIYGCDICLDVCPYNRQTQVVEERGVEVVEESGVEEASYGHEAEKKEGSPNNSISNFYDLHKSANSPFEIDTNILYLTTQDIENMTSGQYRRLTKKSAMSRVPLSQLRRNL